MSYEERVECFWERVEVLRLDCYQIALYMGLLRLFKKSNFPIRCEVENDYLCDLLGIKIRFLREVRQRLIDNNLIVFEAGTGRKQPAYIIDMELWTSLHPTQAQADEMTLPKEVTIKIETETKEKQEEKKKKETKIREKQEAKELNLFTEEKSRPQRRAEPPSPTLEEVVSVCRSKGMTNEEAENFFYYYDAQGWVTTGGQKIKRIDSMVNRWLTNGKEKKNGTDNNSDSAKREARNKALFDEIMSRYG